MASIVVKNCKASQTYLKSVKFFDLLRKTRVTVKVTLYCLNEWSINTIVLSTLMVQAYFINIQDYHLNM